ncbi:MAG: BatA and WFA domain-containing protein [Verrucomicrobiota bacterium]
MTFAAPFLFWFALLALPIIAFYLIKQQLRLKPVTTVLFWQQLRPAVHNAPLWRRLRRWFSLLLQLIILALIVFALARPLFPWQAAGAQSLVLVVDPSVSMTAVDDPAAPAEGEAFAAGDAADGLPSPDERLDAAAAASPRWQDTLRLIEARLGALDFEDEAAVILASDPPQIIASWTNNQRQLREALGRVRPQGGPSDIRPALALAHNLVEGRESAGIEFITDGVWSDEPEEEELAGVAIRRVGVVEEPAANSGLTLFSARRSLGSPGEYQLAAIIENNRPGGEPLQGQLEILRNGGIMDVLEVEVPTGQPWRKEWRATDAGEAVFEARFLPAAPDALAMDNAAQSRLDALQAVDVVLVSEGYPFLEAALDAQGLVTWQRVWPPETVTGPDAAGGRESLYIFHEAPPPEGFAGRAALLVNPQGEGFWGAREGVVEKPLVSSLDREAEPMRYVDFSLVNILEAGQYAPAAGAETLAESFGDPLIFGQWGGPGGAADGQPDRWLVLGFPLEKSDFVFRTAFPIFLGNLVQGLRDNSMLSSGELPGPVETSLEVTAGEERLAAAEADELPTWNYAGFPLWWWLALGGFAVLLGEWFSYARRMTE